MTADDLIAVPGDAADRPRLRSLLRVPGYRNLFLSSLIWHTTRWGALFTTSYLLTQIADAPLLNQVVGALFFVPMLLGGFFAGAISDRFERKRLILVVQLVLIPVEFLMFAAVQSGRVEVWMTFPFMFFVGIGGLVNMTAQRPLIYETVGPRPARQ
jgi:MFS family permease